MASMDSVRFCLEQIYDLDVALNLMERVRAKVQEHLAISPHTMARSLDERDALLITYPDQIRSPEHSPLASLGAFASRYLAGIINGLHILPFFPSSSDDGFAVMDFKAIDPALGDWHDIEMLASRFDLMFDAVVNHASSASAWFQSFLRNEAPFNEYFIRVDGQPDLSSVVRPRTSPLLTEYSTSVGVRKVWTTFSKDQVDLNYHNPALLLDMLDVLLFYVRKGAAYIRLDAIAYIWKEPGTNCIHLPQAHWVVRFFRAILDNVAPATLLLTETNVSMRENISYLGDGSNEANLVYNFGLPPLVLHAFHVQESDKLADWLEVWGQGSDKGAYFNILASHDGIGLNGAREILSEEEITELSRSIERAGGHISRMSVGAGEPWPYELNMNYLDALDAVAPQSGFQYSTERFLTAHAIMLGLRGLPGVYFHSMFGSRGWREGPGLTGRPRAINREKLRMADLVDELADHHSERSKTYTGVRRLLQARQHNAAFAPSAEQQVLRGNRGVLAFARHNLQDNSRVVCLHNLTPSPQSITLQSAIAYRSGDSMIDLISGEQMDGDDRSEIALRPYQSRWLTSARER